MSRPGEKTKKPLVSVITPSYNQGRFIEETIKSVLSQDYPDIEYIVVDGGSKDSTLGILKKYEKRLRWTSEKDNGQADAIEKGFKMSTGSILAWLNSDDIYLEGAVSKAVDYFSKNPEAGMVYGKSLYVDEQGRTVGEYLTEEFDFKSLASFNFIAQPSVFFRRDVYFGAGGIDKGLSYCMDYDLWIRIAKISKVRYLPDSLSCYRLHEESKTVSHRHALGNSRESMETSIKYFGRAPSNKVFAYCHFLLKSKFSAGSGGISILMLPVTALAAIFYYLKLNRGIKIEDLKNLKISNIKKMLRWNC